MADKEIGFAFVIGNETIDPSKLTDPAQTVLLESIVESVYDRVGNLECPEHHESPRFLCSGESFDDLSLEVLGCCDALVEKVNARLQAKQD